MAKVKFLAVARSSDKAVIASYCHAPSDPGAASFLKQVTQVLSAPGWASSVGPTAKLHLDNGPNTFHLQCDDRLRVFVAITASDYPRRLIFSSTDGAKQGILGDLRDAFVSAHDAASMTCAPNGLNKASQKLMAAVARKFEDVRALDKVANIRAKVDEVTETMQENISIVLANSDTIDKIEGKTEVLNTSAARFSKKSTQLRKAMQWRYYKLMGLLALIIGVVLAYILIPIITDIGGGDDS